jgi:hypothetical protein
MEQHRKEDFSFILGGITGILEEHMAVQNGYLPGSKKPVPYILETFMLLWRIVDLNKVSGFAMHDDAHLSVSEHISSIRAERQILSATFCLHASNIRMIQVSWRFWLDTCPS